MLTYFRSRQIGAALGVAMILVFHPTYAAPAEDKAAAAQAELDAAFDAAGKVAQRGPAEVKLAEHALLKLPEGYVYLPPKESARLMLAMGNRTGEGLLGTVFPTGQSGEQWFVVIRFDNAGYIKDDDAKDWKADELLQSLKEGTAQANEERVARGIPEVEVIGWVEKPRYDPATHQLVWSVSSKQKGQPDTADLGINYNTYTLGREGYISMNLVTGLKLIDQDKHAAVALLSGLDFNDGKRYADFNGSTDKVAAYGLAALIGGVAAKKLGLFAAFGVLLVKFWKIALIALVGGGAALGKFFKRGKTTTPA
jgi:uncharacterized membrane-anchored protein